VSVSEPQRKPTTNLDPQIGRCHDRMGCDPAVSGLWKTLSGSISVGKVEKYRELGHLELEVEEAVTECDVSGWDDP
jgi:hypothetical protein